ncbi:hypothetical protein BsWGS_08650 [Bradybaena similaris]
METDKTPSNGQVHHGNR